MRAAIIGCGPHGPSRGGAHSISYAHARAMVNCKNAIKLVAAASRTKKNLEDFATEFPGVIGYVDYREMLTVEKPDFVSICAFPQDREAMVSAALEAGAKGIWVEKPFATSLGAANRMMKAAKSHGARLYVNFQRRYGAPFEWVRKAVEQGSIGKLIGVQINQPGNALINFGPHLIDAGLNVINAAGMTHPTHVFAAAESSEELYQGIAVEAQIVGTVHFSNGVRMILEAGILSASQVPVLRFDGEFGFAELRLSPLDGETAFARGHFKGESAISTCEGEENFHHGKVDTNLYVDRALADILQSLQIGAPCQLDAEAVQPGLEILLAFFESSVQGRMLTLPLTEASLVAV